MKVLVVDDNEALADVIQCTLEDNGLEVISAKDGLDGYDAYVRFEPDLVITDINMPRANGLEMMEHIRAHNPMVKTIYMSADIDAFRPSLERERGRYSVNVFEKPFSLTALTNLVLAK
jgi:CheY-like chemotaxis protein